MILEVIKNILKEAVFLWLAMSPYLLMGMFFAGILHVFLGTEIISQQLGKGSIGSILKATLFGIPLPICSCGVIPVAASLRKEGASKSATLSFLVSTPTTGVDSIMATYSLMGPLFAVFRPIAAFVSGITIGVMNRLINPERRDEKTSHDHLSFSRRFKFKEVFRYGFVELAEDIGKWLLIGIVIGAVLTVVIPEEILVTHFSNPIFHFIFILIFAIPLYVCATGSIPIATALIQKGISPGAALVFLIAGPATNTVTLSFVRSRLGKRAFYLYLSSIVVVSLILGWLFNLLWYKLGGDIGLISPHGEQLPLWLRVTSGAILLVLILKSLYRFGERVETMKYEFSVPDMTCKHCKMTIEDKLMNLPGVEQVVVNLDDKKVGVDGDVNIRKIKDAVREVGYTPE